MIEATFATVITVRSQTPEADFAEMTGRPGVTALVSSATAVTQPFGQRQHREMLSRWQEGEAARTGTIAQRQLHERGLLHADDIAALAAMTLFRPMAEFHSRRPLTEVDIAHPTRRDGSRSCISDDGIACEWSMRLYHRPTGPERTAITSMQDAISGIGRHPWLAGRLASEPISSIVREHTITCARCRRSARSLSVLVMVPWAGRTLSREYAIAK